MARLFWGAIKIFVCGAMGFYARGAFDERVHIQVLSNGKVKKYQMVIESREEDKQKLSKLQEEIVALRKNIESSPVLNSRTAFVEPQYPLRPGLTPKNRSAHNLAARKAKKEKAMAERRAAEEANAVAAEAAVPNAPSDPNSWEQQDEDEKEWRVVEERTDRTNQAVAEAEEIKRHYNPLRREAFTKEAAEREEALLRRLRQPRIVESMEMVEFMERPMPPPLPPPMPTTLPFTYQQTPVTQVEVLEWSMPPPITSTPPMPPTNIESSVTVSEENCANNAQCQAVQSAICASFRGRRASMDGRLSR